MQTKAHSSFDMAVLRRRAKKLLRKKYKKTIKLSKVDKIWKEYCEYAVVKPLLKNGFANLDDNTSLEIVGKRIIDDTRMYNLLSNGLSYRRGGAIAPVGKLNHTRSGFCYKVRLKDKTFNRGQLVFKTAPDLAKKVHKALVEITNYYRIEA